MNLYLDDDQLYERTGFKHRKKQCAELARQKVKFTVRHDGRPLVLRSQFESATVQSREPNFDALKRAG